MIQNEKINKSKIYSLKDAIQFFKKNKFSKFNESIDIAINLNLDVRKSDQNLRGMLSLPKSLDKNIIVAVFAKGEKAVLAKKAGADFVGDEDLFEKINSGFIGFDRCIATPDMMFLVSRLGKILGPRSLMPNPKLGTVTSNVEEAIRSAKSGQVEFRADKFGIVHANLGKVDYTEEDLINNVKYFCSVILSSKPSGVKGEYVKSIFISSTMGPGVKVLVADLF